MRQEPYPIDLLIEKHEYLAFDSRHSISVTADGRDFEVAVPYWIPQLKPLMAVLKSDLLFVTGTCDEYLGAEAVGFFVIARRENETHFISVVCHQLYPQAIEELKKSYSSA